MKKNRFFAIILAMFISAISLVSCAPSDGGDPTSKGKNTDNSFAFVSTWTSSGLVNHYNSNTSCLAFEWLVVEGLYKYVRSSNYIYCQLADGMPTHSTADIGDYKTEMGEDAYNYYVSNGCSSVAVSRVKIRNNAKWQNGEDFVAKDVWAYYYIMHPTSSNYMAAVKVVDNKTVEFVWNPLKEPIDQVKELLISQDKNGSVKYDEFAYYADEIHDLVLDSPVNENLNLWGAFNRFSNPEQVVKLNKLRQEYYMYSPSWYISTGPFRLETFSATQILLTKNKYHWNAENIGFEKIKLYSSNDLNQTYQLIANGLIDYYDGFIQIDTLNSILNSNSDLVNLKMYDPGSIGIIYNLKSSKLTPKVREALQYVFDREEITLSANPYATTSYYPLLGMAASEAQNYMSEEHFNKLPKYSHNLEKATQLLQEAGWTKTDGRWYANGSPVELIMGCPLDHDISSTSAEGAAAQLESFGIHVSLLKTSAFYSNASSDSNPYDLMVTWTDLNMSFSYPTGSYNQFSSVFMIYAQAERYPANYSDKQKANIIKLKFDGLDGDTRKYEFADYISTFYSLKENELSYLVDVFNTGIAKNNYGIQFFQNVTASTINVARVKGVPLEEYWSKNRNVEYVPAFGTEDYYNAAFTNLAFSNEYLLAYGIYQPNRPE